MEQNQTTTQLSKFSSWSLLDPRPVCFYDNATSTHLAVWHGIFMTRNQAMMIAFEKFMNIWATPTMKERSWNEFSRAYYSGAFGHRNWDHILEKMESGSRHYNFLTKMLSEHLKSMQEYQGQDVLSWFYLHKDYANNG